MDEKEIERYMQRLRSASEPKLTAGMHLRINLESHTEEATVDDADLEENVLENYHLLCTKNQDEVEWDGSGLGKWHRQEGCHDSCHHDNQNVNNSPLRKITHKRDHSCSPAKSLNSSESSPAKSRLELENVEDFSWDSEFDDISLTSSAGSPVENVTRKKSAKNKVKEVFQKSKNFLKSKVTKLPLFQSANLMKGENNKTSTQENSSKGSNSELFIFPSKGDTDAVDINNLTTNQLFDCSSNTAYTCQHQDTQLEHEGNSGTTTTHASGCQPPVNSAPSYSVVYGYLSQDSSSTHTNGHIGSSDSKSKAIKMPGLINTTDKANSNCNESTETEENEMEEFVDKIQTQNGTKSLGGKSDGDDVQIKVDYEEDIPLGSEANHYQTSMQHGLNNGNGDYLTVGQAFDKRLSWLLGSHDQNSFGSDFSQNTATSTSSDKSLDMILMERKEDPEMILTNLGFGGSEGDGSTITRIPERFLSQPSYAEGIDLTTLIDDDENLGQILQAMTEGDDSMDCSRISDLPETGNQNYGNSLSSAMARLRFLSAFRNSHSPLSSTPVMSLEKKDTETEDISHPSILHPLNRDWLARQGYYEKSTAVPKNKTKSKSSTPKLVKSVSQDAAERRRRFHQSKSTKHYSLQDVQEMEEDDSESKDSSALTSFDGGYQFRSFATTSMSCDSFDSSESPVYSSPGRSSFRRNDSLIDDEAPVFNDINVISQQNIVTTETSKIANLRKSQVEKLMSLEVDDGDYDVLSPQSSLERTLTWQKLHSMSERSNTMTPDDTAANQKSEKLDLPVDENQNEPGFKKVNVTELGSEACEPSGNIGRMESIQSDSSGFAEADMTADHFTPETAAHQRALNLSPMSSAESDQTYKSGVTVLPGPGQSISPRLTITSPCDLHSELQFIPVCFQQKSSQNEAQKIDKAVGTEDINQLHNNVVTNDSSVPTVTYHMVSNDTGDSGNETVSEKSLTLTIDLPNDWIKSSKKENVTNKRVITHFYKHISPPSQPARTHSFKSVVNIETNSPSGAFKSDSNRILSYNNEPNRHLKSKWVSTPRGTNVTPVHCSTPYERTNFSKKNLFPQSILSPGESIYSDTNSGLSDWQNRSFKHSMESELSDTSYISYGDSTSSLRDENTDYIKLMRLVNNPVSFKRSRRGPKASIRFKPKHNIKAWTHLEKQQHLEEETRLAQYALQRYKTELNVLETDFLVNSHLVKDELMPEEREEIDEFLSILSAVRKEIVEMEQLLANRIGGLNVGNDNFSPLLMMDIIRKMTDLLKEQIFQQKVAVDKDSDDEDLAEPFQQKTHQVPWLPEVSEQLYEIQRNVCNPPSLQLDKGLNDSLQEIRESILHEVRQELHDNTKWLQKQLQDKDRELNRLKMEVMSSSIRKGQTRRKHYYESDV